MKRFLLVLTLCWAALLTLTFINSPNTEELPVKLFLSFSGAILIVIIINGLFWQKDSGRQNNGTSAPSSPAKSSYVSASTSRPSLSKPKILYIFKGTERNFSYRYDGKYVYDGMTSKFLYRVEGSNIYKGLESRVSYRMKRNKIYRGLENQALYRIDGNYIYNGDFGRQPVFYMSESRWR